MSAIIERSQALRVIKKFGGITHLRQLLAIYGYRTTKQQVYRWLLPFGQKGNGGLIPSPVWQYLEAISKNEGIDITHTFSSILRDFVDFKIIDSNVTDRIRRTHSIIQNNIDIYNEEKMKELIGD